jgi:tripartite ATP-independent transporter DctM subunit
MVVLFILRVPVAFAMAIAGVIGFAYLNSWPAAANLLARDFFEQFNSYSLSAITMFVFMGGLSFASGLGERLYRSTYSFIGHIRGGLTLATILACSGFSAICGSTAATAATMGRIALPQMQKYGYDKRFATGCVASGGTLGILIPPSTVFIVYGLLAEQSIGKLFVAGIVPGLILSGLFMLTSYVLCLLHPHYGPPGERATWATRLRYSGGLLETLGIFALVIGGMFLGWFSPTQAGAIGAALVLIAGLCSRQLTWRGLVEAVRDSVHTSCMILSVIAGATVFGHFLAISTIPFVLVRWIESLPFSPPVIMAVIILIYFIGGCFVDAMALITLLTPVLFPVVVHLGYDPIWFGVITVLVSQMGVLTPPVGINVYVVKNLVPDMPLGEIFRGTYPYLLAVVATCALLIAFPKLALVLVQ